MLIDPNSQAPVVVLETVTDKKPLPIWIDVPEARAIALELEHVTLPRPLTHDLIRNILQTRRCNSCNGSPSPNCATIPTSRILSLAYKGESFADR